MRRRRRFFALLFIFSAFVTPLGFFYLTIVNESRHESASNTPRYSSRTEVESDNESEKIFRRFAKFSEQECSEFLPNVTTTHPDCLKKMEWIKNGWKTHQCYADNQVDGSECSFRYYLSEVENYCPQMENSPRNLQLAKVTSSIRRLLPILEVVPVYMKSRINRMWKSWREGAHEVMEQFRSSMTNRRKLNVLVFIGFLANEKQLKLAKKSDHGGPLGELLQWSDLLATLSITGHHLEVATEKDTLQSILYKYSTRGPCQFVNGARQQIDIIFTDIMGLNILRQRHRQFLNSNRCRIRLLDSFGTHAEFTNKSYFLKNKKSLSGNHSERNPWGGHGLDLRQHWTFYPHSHDNTFLGFVVDSSSMRKDLQKTSPPIALVYGKLEYMWKNAEKSISVLKRHVEVHATVADLGTPDPANRTSIFHDVINHGFLNSEEISELLDRTRIFFGLGFPLEGPAPLEAIAHGAVFINAAFREPKSRKNYKFLADKPTLREWTSQNPYMEMLGEPHVITVDTENERDLERAIRKAKTLNPPPRIPFEFQPAGMLLRVAMLLEKQEFCDAVAISDRWPPISQLKIVKTTRRRDSCEMACLQEKLICEPSYFPIINQPSVVYRESPECSSIMAESSPLAPFNCTLQISTNLYSCATRPPPDVPYIVRMCPCRDYLPEQHAICKKCL